MRVFGFIRPYRREALFSLALLALMAVLDLAIPRLIQRIIDEGIARGDETLVVQTALLMLGISALSTLVAIGNNLYSVRTGEGVARDLREAVFLKIQSYSFADLDRRQTGQLLVRLTSDIAAIKSLVQISLRIGTRAPLMIAGSMILMVATSPQLALALLPVLLITLGLIGFFIVKTEPLFRTVQSKLDVLNGVLQENIAGARLVKALVRGAYEVSRFARANAEMTDRSVAVMRFMSAMMPALTMCLNLGLVVVIWSGGLSTIAGELTVGQIVAFGNYLLSTMAPLMMMSLLSNTWAAGLASADRVQELLDVVPEVQDAPDARALPADAAARMEFADVGFAYGADMEPVLQQIALSAAPGQTIAILGATGAGKSTLVALIPRFYDVTSGSVRIAGEDVRALSQVSLLGKIGVVPQESLLFSGTVRDNIRYGRPAASDLEVQAAAEAAQAHEFIVKLPDGYGAPVTARGGNLSGGQKQRLAIARALLLDPELLILDDSTSAVDVETETKIQDALAQNSPRRITFVVAQRISTVLRADQIIVLERGRIVARGTHGELMQSSAVYREIYASQLGDGIAETMRASAEVAPL
jgi:ATP-binding cassette, subfamily B, multidrug efflux pump